MKPRILPFMALLAMCALAAPRAHAAIVINEIMYNSPGATDVEFVELVNTGPAAQDLSGWSLLDDDDLHAPCPLSGILAPGALLVVAGDLTTFQSTYPGVSNVNPAAFAGFSLGNTTDVIRLFDAGDLLADTVTYQDTAPWPTTADGAGPSLELKNPALDNAAVGSWSASGASGGTPGAQNSVFDDDLPPVVEQLSRDSALPPAATAVVVTAVVTDDSAVAIVELYVSTGGSFAATPMFDAGDGAYAAEIPAQPSGTLVRYYVRAEDDAGQPTLFPATAPAEYRAYTVGYLPPAIVINEIMASNQNGIRDEALERDDWLELRNPGPGTVQLGGLFLTDDQQNTTKWPIPAFAMSPGGHMIVWCDDEPTEGLMHATFALGLASGEVGLYDTVDHGNGLLSGFTYGLQSPDRPFGYLPEDSDAPEYLVTPTPAASNHFTSVFSPVCINEFLAASEVGVPDWVEIYNRSPGTLDIGGWHLTDNRSEKDKYTFPGSVLGPGGRLTVTQATLGFALAADGSDVLMLTDASGVVGRDYFDFGPQFSDVSQGRYPDGTPNWHFFSDSSRDLPNSCAQGLKPLPPVVGLRFTSRAALAWDPLAGATVYDVVQGDLVALRATAGDFAAAIADCLENSSGDSLSWEPDVPAAGAAWFYLVRGADFACGFGTFDSGHPRQAASRDLEITAAAASCP